MDACTDTGRWVLGLSSVVGLLILAVGLWTLPILLAARRRIEQQLLASPPAWRSSAEIVARGREPVPPSPRVPERALTDLDASPVTSRSAILPPPPS